MKPANRLAEWLYRFASSQKNADQVAIWLGGTVSVLAATLAVAVMVMLILQ